MFFHKTVYEQAQRVYIGSGWVKVQYTGCNIACWELKYQTGIIPTMSWGGGYQEGGGN